MKGHSDVFNQTIIVIDGRRSAHTAHLLITTKPNLSLESTQGFYRKFIIYILDANLWCSGRAYGSTKAVVADSITI